MDGWMDLTMALHNILCSVSICQPQDREGGGGREASDTGEKVVVQ